MKTFRSNQNFQPQHAKEVLKENIVILSNTDYDIIDTNQAFGIYIFVYNASDGAKPSRYRAYISPEEIKEYGIIQNKLTEEEIKSILENINFENSCINFNWKWEILKVAGTIDGFLINTTFTRPDIATGVIGTGKGRRMWIEETTSETSVVMTAWLCIELIVKHEAMEMFEYSGAKILNPHKTLSELAYPEKLK